MGIYFVLFSVVLGLACGLDCGDPAKPNHSLYNFTGLSRPGSIVYYSCLDGYKLVGSRTRQCYENGTWLPYQPICEPENITCGFPGHGAHGSVNVNGNVFLPGSGATYSCDLGYVLVGPTTRICQQDGKWSYPVPFCAAKVSMHRKVAAVSQFVDIHEKSSRQGSAILDDGNFKCSYAEQADRLTSFWKVDLLEPQKVDVIVLIFGDKIDIDINLRISKPNTFNETFLTVSDYNVIQWSGPVTTRETTQFMTTYEFTLKSIYEFQYLTIETKPSPSTPRLQFCELLVLSKSAQSFGQCFSNRPGSLKLSDSSAALFGNICYSFAHAQPEPWASADVKCKELTGGGLVTDVDVNVQQILRYSLDGAYNGEAMNRNFWIGGITAMSEARKHMPWIWTNDNPIRQYYWGRSQPDMSPNEPACLSLSSNLDWQWDDRTCTNRLYFVCQHRLLQCGAPELPENTLIDYANMKVDIGGTVTYMCPEGYALQGYKTRRCLDGGQWSGSAPFCFADGSFYDRQGGEKLQAGIVIAIVCGVLLGALLLIAVVCFVAWRKGKSGTKVMKYNKQSESAETLDVHDKKATNYSSTDPEK